MNTKEKLQHLYSLMEHLRDEQISVRTEISEMKNDVTNPEFKNGDLVDMLWMLKQMDESISEIGKAIREGIKVYSGMVWMKHLPTMLEGGEKSVRGEYALGTPSAKQISNLPKRESPEYTILMDTLLKEFPSTQEIVASDIFRIHWPTFCELLTERIAKGKPPFDGVPIDTLDYEYNVSCRALR